MSKARKTAAYSLYILGVTLFSLYVLFPSDTLRTYTEHMVAEISPEITLDIQRIDPGIPPGIFFSNALIRLGEKPVVHFDQGRITPSYRSMAALRPSGNFSVQFAGGEMNGVIGARSGKGNRMLGGEVFLSGVDIGQIPLLGLLYPARFSGKLNGEIVYEAQAGEPERMDGNGSALLTVTGLEVELDDDLMGMGAFSFSRVSAEIEIKGGQIMINRFEMEGTQFSATGKGTLLPGQPFESSRINLTGAIQVHPELMRRFGSFIPRQHLRNGELPVRISGTLANPRYTLR